MTPFKVGVRVKRIGQDIIGQGLVDGGEYVVSKCWCPIGNNSSGLENWRVELRGFDGEAKSWNKPCWDAHRFELVEPFYVQACPHGIHWRECADHRHGVK